MIAIWRPGDHGELWLNLFVFFSASIIICVILESILFSDCSSIAESFLVATIVNNNLILSGIFFLVIFSQDDVYIRALILGKRILMFFGRMKAFRQLYVL